MGSTGQQLVTPATPQPVPVGGVPALSFQPTNNGEFYVTLTVIDNTWAAGVLFKPLDHGVDVSIQSLTKYVCGHSDIFMGLAAANGVAADLLASSSYETGWAVSPADAYMAMRGLRTLHTRLAQHGTAALEVAEWLEKQPEVQSVMCPALARDPGHMIWKRDFTGICGLIGAVLGLLVPFAVRQFELPDDDGRIAVLYAALGTGGLIAGLALPRVFHVDRIRRVAPACLAAAGASVAFSGERFKAGLQSNRDGPIAVLTRMDGDLPGPWSPALSRPRCSNRRDRHSMRGVGDGPIDFFEALVRRGFAGAGPASRRCRTEGDHEIRTHRSGLLQRSAGRPAAHPRLSDVAAVRRAAAAGPPAGRQLHRPTPPPTGSSP